MKNSCLAVFQVGGKQGGVIFVLLLDPVAVIHPSILSTQRLVGNHRPISIIL